MDMLVVLGAGTVVDIVEVGIAVVSVLLVPPDPSMYELS
jgi:hypothetical protein